VKKPLRAMASPDAPQDQPGALADAAALVAFASQGAFGFLLGALGPCLVLLSRDLAAPRDSLSWVSSGFGVGLLVLGTAGERLLRMGAGRLLRISVIAQGLGCALLALAPQVLPAKAGALLLGLGGAGMVLATPVLLAGAGATVRMARAFGLSSLTGIASPLLLSFVDATTGHGRTALLLALPALLWAATRVVTAGAPAPAAAPARAPASAPRAAPATPTPGAGRTALRWWVALVAAVAPEFAFVVWGAARLQDSGLSPTGAAAAAAAFPIGMAFGRLVVVPRFHGHFPLVAAGVALAAAGALACAAPLPPLPIALAIAAAGVGIAPLYPLTIDALVHAPNLHPRWGSAVGALGSGAAVLLAPILLIALARVVSLRLAFLAALPLLALVLALDLRHRRRTRA
jgi:hypothetical protein